MLKKKLIKYLSLLFKRAPQTVFVIFMNNLKLLFFWVVRERSILLRRELVASTAV